MRKEVFDEYYKRMVKIINYKETDENGNERKCTVSVAEAKKHPEKYEIYEFKHPSIKGQSFAYDPELVKKHTDTFKYLCSILPQHKFGVDYLITLEKLHTENTKQPKKERILGESFFAMARECGIINYILNTSDCPNLVEGALKEKIPTSYKETPSHDGK